MRGGEEGRQSGSSNPGPSQPGGRAGRGDLPGSGSGMWDTAAAGTLGSTMDVAAKWDNNLSPGQLSTLVWAWGKLRYRSGTGMRMVALLLYGSARELASADIARWAFMAVG